MDCIDTTIWAGVGVGVGFGGVNMCSMAEDTRPVMFAIKPRLTSVTTYFTPNHRHIVLPGMYRVRSNDLRPVPEGILCNHYRAVFESLPIQG